MTSRALVALLMALPLLAAAQVGGQPLPPPPEAAVPPPPPPPAMAEPQAAPPPAPQAVPAPPPQAAPPVPPPPPPQAVAPPPAPAPAQAEAARQPRENKWRLSASVGAGSSYGNTYFLVGARGSRELALGLALEIDGQYWAGQSPSLGKIAPGITWYSPFRAYLGAYYARWFVGSGFPDQDAVGARAGYTFFSRGRTFAGVGVAYEKVLDCSTNCDSWWPEASVGVAF